MVTGTEFNYYQICHRKLWLFSHGIQMEQDSDLVLQGKLIHEHSYPRKKKEIYIDGTIKIDFFDEEEGVHEVKKSNKMEDAHIYQLLYYIYYLRQKNVDVNKGVINYPKQRRKVDVEFTPEKELEIETMINNIQLIKNRQNPPDLEKKKICRRCSYQELCYA